MGGPQYGRLVIDGETVASAVERGSLVWSGDRSLLAVQELDTWQDSPRTLVTVFDARAKSRLAATPPRTGLTTPLRFAGNELLYREWTERGGEQVLTLDVVAE